MQNIRRHFPKLSIISGHTLSVHCRDGERVELNVGDEVEFSMLDSSTKPIAENIRKLKTGTILSVVCDPFLTLPKLL